jgi:hypothetical protein
MIKSLIHFFGLNSQRPGTDLVKMKAIGRFWGTIPDRTPRGLSWCLDAFRSFGLIRGRPKTLEQRKEVSRKHQQSQRCRSESMDSGIGIPFTRGGLLDEKVFATNFNDLCHRGFASGDGAS